MAWLQSLQNFQVPAECVHPTPVDPFGNHHLQPEHDMAIRHIMDIIMIDIACPPFHFAMTLVKSAWATH